MRVALVALAVALLPAAAGPTRLAVYLARGGQVAPVRRGVPHTVAVLRASLGALLEGPTAAERRAGYVSAIPAGTRVLGVTLAGGVATVELSRRLGTLGAAQVVHTATQFPTLHRVSFGHGPPVGRAAFEAEAPPILVEQPLPGDTVRTPIVVRGTANVFEAGLDVDVVAAGGRRLAHRPVMATAGTGTRGTFETVVPVRTAPRHVTVVAYTLSPKDGSRIAVVRVPVTLAH